MRKPYNSVACVVALAFALLLLSSCGENDVYSKNQEEESGVTSVTTSQEVTSDSNQSTNDTISASQDDEPSEMKTSIEKAKEKPVSELLTYKTISDLTVTLGELFNNKSYYMADWLDSDAKVELWLKKESTSNTIIMSFAKNGEEIDFPQVSTMITTNDGGNQYIFWSFEDLDSALIEILLAEGYITDNGGYQVIK